MPAAHTSAADRAQEELARERVLAERLKAARELHDVVGHAVTVISLQAAVAARYATRDLTAARTAAATVLDVAGDAERELAALGQLLESEPPPVATLEDVITRVREAGLPVTLVERLDDVELALPLSLTVVRVVQEALTNVGKHAGRARTRSRSTPNAARSWSRWSTRQGVEERRRQRPRRGGDARARRALRRHARSRPDRGRRLARASRAPAR